MTVVLYRIDDRLIHGQVVIGWGQPLGARFIVLVDDQVFATDWERDLYRMGVPSDVDVIFASVAEATRLMPEWRADPRRGIVVTADIATMAALSRLSPSMERVNLGGLHHRPGRSPKLTYVYLTDDELEALERMQASGVEVKAQDLPSTPPVSLESLR